MGEPWESSPGAPYIRAVMDGEIDVCESIRLCVERAVDDHINGPARGLVYVPKRAQKVIEYAKLCLHTKGKWAGKPFIHEPWQAFVTGELFGWYWRQTKQRRFRVGFIEIPKKSGKSAYLSVLGVYMLDGDGEPGAEVYSIASEKNQAGIIFRQSRAMVLRSERLKSRIRVLKDTLSIEDRDSVMLALPSDPDSIDGINPNCMLVDELHRHKSRAIWDVALNSTVLRDNPMVIAITTAGDDLTSICYEQHEYAIKIINQVFTDDEYFTFVATPDDDYDWDDEEHWYKVNPGLGSIKSIEDMRAMSDRSKQSPKSAIAFRRFQLNEWTKEVGSWLNMQIWFENNHIIDPNDLEGKPCFAGLDIGIVKDMSAIALVYDIDDYLVIVMRYYCPEVSVRERSDLENLPYQDWVDRGLLIQTPGNVVDQDFIFEDTKSLMSVYDVRDFGFDPYRAHQLGLRIEAAGLSTTEVPQSNMRLNEAVDVFEKKYLERKIVHYNHEILAWNASNVVLNENRNKMRAPDRRNSREKIDGIAAVINAISRMIAQDIDIGSYTEDDMPFVIRV